MKPEAPREEQSGFPAPGTAEPHPAATGDLWEELLSRGNLMAALRRVEQNAGAPGVDGMQTKELRSWLHDHWPEVLARLDAGTYRPQPTRRVTIPKPSGGERALGGTAYFSLADTPRPLSDLDEWLRRRLRQVRWKEWKRVRTKRRNLRALGIPEEKAHAWANTRKGYWRIAGSAPASACHAKRLLA